MGIPELSFDKSIELIQAILESGHVIDIDFAGTSMLPTLQPESSLSLKTPTSLNIGGIYVYVDHDKDSFSKLVCHRLVEKCAEDYIFKGDNRSILDLPVPKENIIAEVISWKM